MGARLPPGEAERRAAERKRATWSGANYARYDPLTEGYGSFKSWADAAAAFIHGDPADFVFLEEPAKPAPEQQNRKPVDPRLAALGLDDWPDDVKALTSAYRRAVMTAFKSNGYIDTSEGYVSAFAKITKAYDNLKLRRSWR